MKKVLLTTATLLGVTAATVLATNNQRVQASETTVQETKGVKVYGPIKNGPLHKYVSNVYRYSSWGRGDGYSTQHLLKFIIMMVPTVAICIETVPGWITILKQIETDGLACIQEM